jgi:hypothetical protein
MSEPRRIDETLYEIPADVRPDMRVPARVFADEELLSAIVRDRSLEQLQNVATLPGIVDAALAMPDIHQGYGFPVGGLAATELPDGVVSPGGVGYDINCFATAHARSPSVKMTSSGPSRRGVCPAPIPRPSQSVRDFGGATSSARWGRGTTSSRCSASSGCSTKRRPTRTDCGRTR